MASNLTLWEEPTLNALKLLSYGAGRWTTLRRDGSYQYENPLPGEVSHFGFPQTDEGDSLVAFTAVTPCREGNECIGTAMRYFGYVWNGVGEPRLVGPGRAFISANGRWAVTMGEDEETTTRLDLLSGAVERIRMSCPALMQRRAVANDGSVFCGEWKRILVWRPGQTELQVTPAEAVMGGGGIDATGRWFYSSGDKSFVRYDIESGETRLLLQGNEEVTFMDVSTDGIRALVKSGASYEGRNPERLVGLWLVFTDTGDIWSQVNRTNSVNSVAEGSLSGDGRWLFILDGDCGLWRVELATGAMLRIAPSVPRVAFTDPHIEFAGEQDHIAPRGFYWLWGRNFSGVRVFLDQPAESIELFPQYSSPFDLEFTVPYSMAPGPTSLRFLTDSPFQPFGWRLNLAVTAPSFLRSRGPLWFHEDGSEISVDSPARYGETIEVRMTGLGSLDASGRPVNPVLFSLVWLTGDATEVRVPVELLVAHPFPGHPGEHFVRLRLPGSGAQGTYMGLRVSIERDWTGTPLPIEGEP